MELVLDGQQAGTISVKATGPIAHLELGTGSEPIGKLLGADPCGQRVMLDLADVETLDSSGVGWLVSCHKRFAEAGGRFVVHSPQPVVMNVLKVLKMYLVLRIASDGGQARIMLDEENK